MAQQDLKRTTIARLADQPRSVDMAGALVRFAEAVVASVQAVIIFADTVVTSTQALITHIDSVVTSVEAVVSNGKVFAK